MDEDSKETESLENELTKYEVLQKKMNTKLDALIGLFKDWRKNTEEIPTIIRHLKDHERRIHSIEQSLITREN